MNIFRKIFGSKAGFKGEDPGFGKIDTDKIFPRIKPVWDDDAHELQTEKTLKIKDNDAPVYSELAKGVGLFYVIVKGDNFEFILTRYLPKNNILLDEIKQHALRNLEREILTKTELRGDADGVMMAVNGGNYEAAMILLDAFWLQVESFFKTKIYFAIPCTDILLITKQDSEAGKEKMRKMITHFFYRKINEA